MKYKTVPIVQLKMVKEDVLEYQSNVHSKEDIVKMLEPLYKDSYREIFTVIGLDNSNKPSVVHIVSYGSPNQSAVYPANVLKPLLLSNASAFIVVHNHPADTLQPSVEDKKVTRKLQEAGKIFDIHLLDHLILNSDCSANFSFASKHLL